LPIAARGAPGSRGAIAATIRRTSTDVAPWFVIPADHKWYRDWAVAHLLLEALEDIDPQYPPPDFDVAAELAPESAADHRDGPLRRVDQLRPLVVPVRAPLRLPAVRDEPAEPGGTHERVRGSGDRRDARLKREVVIHEARYSDPDAVALETLEKPTDAARPLDERVVVHEQVSVPLERSRAPRRHDDAFVRKRLSSSSLRTQSGSPDDSGALVVIVNSHKITDAQTLPDRNVPVRTKP